MARLSLKDSILLFIYNRIYIPKCKKLCNWSKRHQLQKLFSDGEDRIENELNIVKLLNQSRFTQMLLRHLMFSRRIKFSLAHQWKNVIDCDAESDEDIFDELFSSEGSHDKEDPNEKEKMTSNVKSNHKHKNCEDIH